MNQMTSTHTKSAVDQLSSQALENKLRKACKKIAPLWPLERFSAVNPYLGLTHQSFQEAAIELSKTAGIKSSLPLSFYISKIEAGEINLEDISTSLEKLQLSDQFENTYQFITQLKANLTLDVTDKGLDTLADTAGKLKKEDWSRLMVDRISAFSAAYYDTSQAMWKRRKTDSGLFAGWKEEAAIDRSTDIMGLKNFRRLVNDLPNSTIDSCKHALAILQVPKEGLNHYLFKLLTQHAGWAAHTARIDWESQLNGQPENELIDFLAICLVWEANLFQELKNPSFEEAWNKNLLLFAEAEKNSILPTGLMYALIMQEAFDIAAQRELISKFSKESTLKKNQSPEVQAIFCIDVRSEIFRRKLEAAHPNIETMGFAGFFGFPISFQKIGGSVSQPQCPVLLKPAFEIKESFNTAEKDQEVAEDTVIRKDIKQAWKSFKSSAISCFSFVSPLGLAYLPKLISDSLGISKPSGEFKKTIQADGSHHESSVAIKQQEADSSGIGLEDQIALAEGALKAMSLTENFAKMVLIVGHGAHMVNNPHAASYDCGACGGHAGDANAKVAAAVLNNPAVRKALEAKNIKIPETTHFVACLHETTTDQIKVYQENSIPQHLKAQLQDLKVAFEKAGEATRAERFTRFQEVGLTDIQKSIESRSKDWSQLRPEWGLAGCSSFIVAPRHHSSDHNLNGKSFLHTYDWKKDQGFKVLEAIMTAPMVVTSWINLQYFGSTVDNKQFGSGNKTLHNITSGIGVIEGNSGDLRVGLPEQAIHDGEKYQHEPLRLSVVIEAPVEAINKVLAKNINIQQLCDNEWIFLFAMNEKGQISQQYAGDLNWKNTL